MHAKALPGHKLHFKFQSQISEFMANRVFLVPGQYFFFLKKGNYPPPKDKSLKLSTAYYPLCLPT